jgi:hypothetical protein
MFRHTLWMYYVMMCWWLEAHPQYKQIHPIMAEWGGKEKL